MRRMIVLAALLAVMPAYAMAADGVTNAMLAKLPPPPRDAASAYAQWHDTNGTLTKGAVFTGLENAITAEATSIVRAAQAGGSMAMGPVSEHDQAALKQIAPYPQTTALRATVSQVAVYLTNLHNDYERNTAKIDAAQAAETAKLPVCPGEAGVPSSSAVASVRLKYADQRIALATATLGRAGTVIAGAHQAVAGETVYADRVYAVWSSLADGMMKTAGHATVAGMQVSAMGDVAAVLGYIEDASKLAAQAVADKNKLARDAAQAKRC